MKNIIQIIMLIALTAVYSFSQEENKTKLFGGRALFNINSLSTGNSSLDQYVNTGYGYGIGVIERITIIANSLTVDAEFHFLYREIFSSSIYNAFYATTVDENVSEFAFGISPMLNFMPAASVPFYLSAGAQMDWPFSSKYEIKAGGQSQSTNYQNRSSFDFGIVMGAGYNATENLTIDFRFVLGLKSLSSVSGDNSSFNQFNFGVIYFY